jgi:hypothetical protein
MALAGGPSTSQLRTTTLKLLGHHQALAGGPSTSQLPTTILKLLRHHQALAGGSSTSQLQNNSSRILQDTTRLQPVVLQLLSYTQTP